MTTITTTIHSGIQLKASGAYVSPLTVATSGAILSTYRFGVYGASQAVSTVVNFGTIQGSATVGIGAADGVFFAEGGSVNNAGTTALIDGYGGVYMEGTVAGTVTNLGTISASGAFSNGVQLVAGGTVTNSGTAALITGGEGIQTFGDATVTNAGTISGGAVGLNSEAVSGIGTVNNTGTIEGSVGIYYHAAEGRITNSGVVAGATGIKLAGTVDNSGLITATGAGIILRGGSVGNTGTITATGAAGVGVSLSGAGTVGNSLSISGVAYGVKAAAPATITNTGGITATGTAGVGIELADGGSIDVSGSISGFFGVRVAGAAGTISDSGTIVGTGGTAVSFGTANDLLTLVPGNLEIQGTVNGGGGTNTLEFGPALTAGTLTGIGADFVNFTNGTVDSGAYWVLAGTNTFASGGTVTESGTLGVAGTLANAGSLSAVSGVIVSGVLVNSNTISTPGSAPSYYAVSLTPTGTLTNTSTGVIGARGDGVGGGGESAVVVNLGTIEGVHTGVFLNAGGSIVNGATNDTTALVTGNSGVEIQSGAGTVTNYGTVGGAAGDGIVLHAGGSIGNSGFATGSNYGIVLYGAGTVTNAGMASGGVGGVRINDPTDVVVNYGTISGSSGGAGVVGADGGTIIDAGTLIGSASGAVEFLGTDAGLVVLRAGYSITGGIRGSASASDQVQLQGTSSAHAVTATYSDLGLTNIGTVGFAPGDSNYATLRITDNATLPHTIGNFTGSHDTIDLTALSDVGNDATTNFNTLTNVLTVTGDNGSVQLQLGTASYAGIGWTATNDGSGGTDVRGGIAKPVVTESLVSDTGVSSTDGITSNPAVTGGADANATVTITEGVTTLGTATSGASGVWSFTPTGLAEGSNTLVASETNGGGTGTASVTFTLDTVVPAVAITSGGGLTNQATQTIVGTVSDTNLATNATITVFDNATPIGTTTESGGNWSTSVTLSGDGEHSITAQATDRAGNTGTSNTDALTLDTTAPAAPTGLALATASDSGTVGDDLTNQTTPTITGNGVSGDTIALFDGNTNVGTGTVAGGTWSIATSTLGNGSHSLTAQETDLAGNASVLSSPLAVTVDTTPPVTTPASLTVLGNSTAQAIGIAAPTDALALTITATGLPADGTVFLADGTTPVALNEVLTTGQLTGLEFQPTAGLFATSSSFTYSAEDAAGNSTGGTATLVIAPAPATITSVAPSPATGDLDAGSSVSITLAMSGAVTVSGVPTLTLNDQGGTATYDAAKSTATALVFDYTVAAGENIAALAVMAVNLPNGATIIDSNGNAADLDLPASATFSGLQIDTTAPATSPASLTVDGDSAATAIGIAAPTDASPLTITATGLPTDGTVFLSDGTTPVTQGEVLTAAQLTSLDFTPTPGLFDTSSSFAYSVVDAAGNGTAGSATLAIAAQSPSAPGDLTGDGVTDTLMTNTVGALVLDEVSGGQMGYTQIGGLGPEWQFEGAGAFLPGENEGELLWDSNNGVIVVAEDVGGTAQYTPIAGIGPEWQFEGNGALLGHGQDDFLIWDGDSASSSYGALVVGEVSGGTAAFTQIGGIGPEWQFKGVGDYLGDGNAGFLIESSNTGALVVGEDAGGAAQYTQIGGLGPEWQFEGSGNLLGHGQDDFLIWDGDSASPQFGALVVGEVTGGAAQYTQIGAVGPEWQFLGVGNYDGSSPSEFLMHSTTTGALVIGTVANDTATYTQIGGVGPEWNFHTTNPATLV